MNKLIRLIQTYLLVGFPFVIACMIWQTFSRENDSIENAHFFTKILQEMLGINIIVWFCALILFLCLLVILPSVREKTLRRLANLKDRDEREEYITGKAARASYISTLSLMILFLFFSTFSFNLYRIPKDQMVNGKHLTVNIKMGFSLLQKSEPPIAKQNIIFTSEDFLLSTSAVVFILLAWQLLVFNWVARKNQIGDKQ